MKRFSLPQILDSIFAAFCAFLLIFIVVRYYVKNVVFALIFGIVAGVLCGALVFIYLGKRRGKKLLSLKDEKQKSLLAIHLCLSKNEELQKLVAKLFCINPDNGSPKGNVLCGQDTVYFLHFTLEKLKLDDIAEAIKFSTENKKIILCNDANSEQKNFADNFLIEIFTLNELYPLIKDKGLLPEKFIFEGKQKLNVFKKIKSKFNKKLTAPLFFCGLWLLIFSYFTFFPVYYIFAGGALIILSAASLVFGK
jgi:hypothetical protein